MDPTCTAPKEGAESGEQPEERPNRPWMKTGSERVNVEPEDVEWDKGERQCNESTLYQVLHLLLGMSVRRPREERHYLVHTSVIAYTDATVTVDNETLRNNVDIERPTYANDFAALKEWRVSGLHIHS